MFLLINKTWNFFYLHAKFQLRACVRVCDDKEKVDKESGQNLTLNICVLVEDNGKSKAYKMLIEGYIYIVLATAGRI